MGAVSLTLGALLVVLQIFRKRAHKQLPREAHLEKTRSLEAGRSGFQP
jgi:hypothetical protein